jgi:hypothetical protein
MGANKRQTSDEDRATRPRRAQGNERICFSVFELNCVCGRVARVLAPTAAGGPDDQLRVFERPSKCPNGNFVVSRAADAYDALAEDPHPEIPVKIC